MKNTKKIKIQDKNYEITKLSIGQFASLMLSVDNLPAKFQKVFTFDELANLTNEAMLTKIPKLIAEMQDDIFSLVSVASGIEKEEIESADFEEFVDLITIILELNNFQAVFNKLKNLGKVLQSQK
ncbi:hypothetical protein [Candidatus Contubernalis alkaliaceticus]|uniref:hypothetical protein n=1 Tax=Candidatus Contubernalis alkaliaceticus TaxID=338645 RepID=UPI001F4BFC70|nr:hypothetical protein [Candidatus Contubernalis alkalaceticus]UNC92708.1 hypothetical protein HUE98_11745 [Candidatus Contubernalis alkalaceticus]